MTQKYLLQQVLDLCTARNLSPQMVFLGGSQASNTKQPPLSGSDYDLVVMVAHTPYAVSYNNVLLPALRTHADIIIRDAETLAFEHDLAAKDGKSAVQSILASGDILYDPYGLAHAVQAHAAYLRQQGPAPRNTEAEKKRFEHDAAQLAHAIPAVKFLGSLALQHQAAELFLHTQRTWASSGKIMARELRAYPEQAALLQTVDCDGLYSFASSLPTCGGEIDDTKQTRIAQAEKEKKPFLRLNYLARVSDTHCQEFYHSNNILERQAAQTARVKKLNTCAGALDPQRFDRAPDEYHFALARFVIEAATMAAIQNKVDPTGVEKYNVLCARYPDSIGYIRAAQMGAPHALQGWTRDIVAQNKDAQHGMTARYDPMAFRMGV